MLIRTDDDEFWDTIQKLRYYLGNGTSREIAAVGRVRSADCIVSTIEGDRSHRECTL